MRVANLGAGVLGARRGARVTAPGHSRALYDAAALPGGHFYTVDAGGCAVDLGFIVFATASRYPAFFALPRRARRRDPADHYSFSCRDPG